MIMKNLFKMNNADNVYVAKIIIYLEDGSSVGRGHKIASRTIKKGEKVIKFGRPIGTATQDINKGDHVHLHNLKSDYLPTYTRDAVDESFNLHKT